MLDNFFMSKIWENGLSVFWVQLPCGSYSTNRTDGLNSAFDALHQVTIDVRSPVAGKIESVLISYLLGDYLCVDLFEYVI